MTEPQLTAVEIRGECLVANSATEAGAAIEEAIRYAKWKGEPLDLVIDDVRLHIHGDSLFDTIASEWQHRRAPQPYYQ